MSDPKSFEVMEERLKLFCAANEFTFNLEHITGKTLRAISMKSTEVDGVENFFERITKEETPFGTRFITTKRECNLDGRESYSMIKIDEPHKDGRTVASEIRTLCGAGVETIQKSYEFEPAEAGCCVSD